ncbi:MAG: hypothetical protein WA747_14330 [Steroidobacteraceae bacterium]
MSLGNLLRTAAMALRAIGPYALLELVMPGGTLLALCLFVYRRRRRHARYSRASVDPVAA